LRENKENNKAEKEVSRGQHQTFLKRRTDGRRNCVVGKRPLNSKQIDPKKKYRE